MKLSSLLRALTRGGMGLAAAVMLPRVASFAAQWALALVAGPAELAALANYMYRGVVVVALVSGGLPPTLTRRARAMTTRAGRALAGGAIAMIASVAFSVTLAHELGSGLGVVAALVTAFFSACSLFAAASKSVLPIWQLQGRLLQVLAAVVFFSPCAAMAAALAGSPAAVAVALGLASAAPAMLLVRPIQIQRAARYALLVVRHSFPYSLASFSTVVVYPLSLSACQPLLGDHRVGQQVLYWSFFAALSQLSQTFAARAVTNALASGGGEADWYARAIRAWLPAGAALSVVGAIIFALFAVPIPWLPFAGAAREAMTLTMLVSGVCPILTDAMCIYFSGPRSRRVLPIGSVVSSACVAGVLLLAPEPLVRHFGVFGPSALVSMARLAFLTDAPVRRYALGTLFLLVSAFGLALALGRGVGV
ncbi:hypothetical protein WME76_34265 [Sorangium sp. So ce119]|uniref:hypothetical protein n=1 Tax=Sorangium sp. So ce119 TaxID=3133279 RepID=UPI003F5E15AC